MSRRERRELEKQQRKQKDKQIRSLGLSRTESKLMRAPAISKEQKKKQKNIEKKYNYRLLRSLGYTTDEAKRFQSASTETINKLSKQLATPLKPEAVERNKQRAAEAAKREAAARKRQAEEDGRHLVIYWRDLIEFADQDAVDAQRSIFRYMRIPELEESLKGLSQLTFGESPASVTAIRITPNLERTREYYRQRYYLRVYEGTGRSYRHLLVALNTMMLLLYDTGQKRELIMDVINNLRELHTKNAGRLFRLVMRTK
jgi:hypothetical protein